MNEAGVRLQLKHMFERFDLDAKHYEDLIVCPVCKHHIVPERGRPDLVCMNPRGLSCYVEVKVFPRGKSFPFSNIRPEQREWLNDWSARRGLAYLGLGTVTGKAGSKSNPRRCWLVPWSAWIHIEDAMPQGSLPLVAKKHYGKGLQEQELDALHLLAPWELEWVGGGWHPKAAYEWR